MPKFLPPAPCSIDELNLFAQELEMIAARLRAVAVRMGDVSKEKPLFIFTRDTLERGINHAREFAAHAEESLFATAKGEPLGPNSTKGRNGGKKKGRKPTKKKG